MTPRPTALPVHADTIPAALRAERRWVEWRFTWEIGSGRWVKRPNRKTNESSSWLTFDDAVARYRARQFDGIGFCLGDGWSGVDLDHCRDPQTGALLPAAQLVVDTLAPAYVEVSPSGTGVKALFRGTRIGFEVRYHEAGKLVTWQGARFFAITGHGAGDPTADGSTALDFWLPPAAAVVRQIAARRPAPGGEDDENLIIEASGADNGKKFFRLWRGDRTGYASASEADLALCCLLAFWTGYDGERVDRLFRRSALYRAKWEQSSYRRSTLDKALIERIATAPVVGVRGLRELRGLRGL